MNNAFIQGRGNLNMAKPCGFVLNENKNKNLILFLGYSDCDVPIGFKFEFQFQNETKSVEIKMVNLGFGPPWYCIPKGFKSLVLVEGDVETIEELKKTLIYTTDWHQSK